MWCPLTFRLFNWSQLHFFWQKRNWHTREEDDVRQGLDVGDDTFTLSIITFSSHSRKWREAWERRLILLPFIVMIWGSTKRSTKTWVCLVCSSKTYSRDFSSLSVWQPCSVSFHLTDSNYSSLAFHRLPHISSESDLLCKSCSEDRNSQVRRVSSRNQASSQCTQTEPLGQRSNTRIRKRNLRRGSISHKVSNVNSETSLWVRLSKESWLQHKHGRKIRCVCPSYSAWNQRNQTSKRQQAWRQENPWLPGMSSSSSTDA